MEPEHKAFPRPSTFLNKALDSLLQGKPKNEITIDKINHWLDNSLLAYEKICDNSEPLERIQKEIEWNICEESPENVWFGEAKFLKNEQPKIIVYKKSLATKLPKKLFELSGQAGIDHMVGHLYPFYNGQADYGEAVACALQHRAARTREGFHWKTIAVLIPPIYKLHKRIPLSNYK